MRDNAFIAIVETGLEKMRRKERWGARKRKKVQDIGEYLKSFKCAYDNCSNSCPMAFSPTEIKGVIFSCVASFLLYADEHSSVKLEDVLKEINENAS